MQSGVESADAGVVDENVDAPEGAVDACGGIFKLMQYSNVAGDDFGFASSFFDGATWPERGAAVSIYPSVSCLKLAGAGKGGTSMLSVLRILTIKGSANGK